MIILLSTGNIIAQEEEIIEEEVIEDEIVIKEERKVISLTELSEIMSADKSEITIYNYKIIASEKDEKLVINKYFFKIFEINPRKEKDIRTVAFS